MPESFVNTMPTVLIDIALRWKKTILVIFAAIFVTGIVSVLNLPIDAFPDVSPKLVRVFVEVNATAAEEVERLVTAPIEREMSKIKGVKRVKSVSSYGLCTVRIYFDDDVDINLARQLVNERITLAEEQIPESLDIPHGIEMGAISSGTGKILAYYIESRDGSLIDVRTLQDSTIKPMLEKIDGVSEVLSQGGYVKQLMVSVDPKKLEAYGVTVPEVIESVRRSNLDVGGGLLKRSDEEWIVRSLGRLETIEDIKSVFITKSGDKIVLLEDVASVEIGPADRRGVASLNGEKEIVTGSVYKSPGENSFRIIEALRTQIDELNSRLPDDIKIVPYYDQGSLVAKSIDTVRNALLTGLALVSVISIIFLRRPKNAIMVLTAIPFSMLFSVIVLKLIGMSGDLISLGGLAVGLGMIVDASIIMVEKIHYNRQNLKQASITEVIRDSYLQVASPIMFSIAIIIIVFLPIWTLTGVEGKMFRPLVISVTVAMFASLLYALLVIPALYKFTTKDSAETVTDRAAKETVFIKIYKVMLGVCLKNRLVVAGVFVLSLIAGAVLLQKVGRSFMPIMEEGTIHVVAHMDPNIALDEIAFLSREIEKEVMMLDEVEYAVTDIGYGDVGPHVHHTNYASLTVGFKPKETWKNARTQNDIVEQIYKRLTFFPAKSISFTQPIQHEVDDLISGSGSQVVIKVFGNDMDELKTIGEDIKALVSTIEGSKDLYIDQITGQTQVRIIIDRPKLAQYDLDMTDIQTLINASVGGARAGKMFNGDGYVDISVRLNEDARNSVDAINNLVLKTGDSDAVRVKDVAKIETVDGLMQINRERGNRFIRVQCNVRGRDVGGFIDEARHRVAKEITMPLTYYVTWGGQFELQEAANKRFMIVIPITLIIVILLLFSFHDNYKEMLLILSNIPFSVVGGIAFLYVFKQDISIPSTIGFIALFGIALQDSLVLINRFKYLQANGADLAHAVVDGCVSKLRPVLMTTLTTALALVPLVFSTGVGAEIQRPLAIVVVGGLLSSTTLTLFIIPTFYKWMFEKR